MLQRTPSYPQKPERRLKARTGIELTTAPPPPSNPKPIPTTQLSQHSMLSASRRAATSALSRQLRVASRPFTVSTTVRTTERPAVVEKNEAATPQVADNTVPETVGQAPNRSLVWSRSQKPRAEAMTGPRFEQTDFSLQVSEATPTTPPELSRERGMRESMGEEESIVWRFNCLEMQLLQRVRKSMGIGD